jgi:hypothetical protein
MFNGIKAVLLTALILFASAGSKEAASLGINFLGDGEEGTDAWRLAPTDEAGVVLQTHWNNVNTTPTSNVGVADSLVDEAGNFTSVQLAYAANDAWNSDGFSDTPDEKLMKGILKQGGEGSTMTLTFTNLSSESLDVYVYGSVNGGPVELEVTIGATTLAWQQLAAYDDSSGYLDATDPVNGGLGDYLKFSAVTPVDGAITITATYLSGSDGLGISGLQLVAPTSFPSNSVPVDIVRQPQPALATPGATATFTVQVTGSFVTYQWFREDVLIPGATAAQYTTPPLTQDDTGTRFKVEVMNNVNTVMSAEATITVTQDPTTRVASIGVNFLGDGDAIKENGRLAPTESAGVIPQANWNNIVTTGMDSGAFPPTGALSDPLVDQDGELTVVQLHFKANDAWNSDGTIDSPDEKLMKGILKNYPGSSMVLTVTNLAPAFYDVYLYGNVNGGPMDMDVTVNAITNYWTAPAAFQEAAGFLDASSLDPDARGEGNYIKVIGVTPVSGGITVTATHVDGADGAAIAGLQVFSSVAFSTGLQITLTAKLEANTILLSWDAPTYRLQYRTDLNEGDWADEPTEPEISGNQATARLPATGTAKFFRLRSG